MSNRPASDTVAGSASDRVDEILSIVREVLAKPTLGADDEVMDHGGTSLSVVRILAEARRTNSGKTDAMRLDFAARYAPTSVHVYPDTDVVEEYGGQVSLDRYGAVLVSGENRHTHNRIATHTTTGHPFRRA